MVQILSANNFCQDTEIVLRLQFSWSISSIFNFMDTLKVFLDLGEVVLHFFILPSILSLLIIILQPFFQESLRHLDSSKDQTLEKSVLPNGKLPIWIQRGNRIKDLDILNYIKAENLLENESVTVVCKENCNSLIKDWCSQVGWKCLPYDHMVGCEDKCIISLDCLPTFELISRARNYFIFVSTQQG